MAFRKRFLAAVCAAVVLTSALSGCGRGGVDEVPVMKPSASVPDDDWERPEGTAVLENSRLRFELNTETAHFTVTDKQSGAVFSSVPADNISSGSSETDARLRSEITVRYYEEQTDALYMYSDTDSVQNGNFTVTTDGKAIRVKYIMGAIGQFVPLVFDADTFQKVLDSFEGSGLRRRFERYYVLYSEQDKPDDWESKLALYPVLANRSLYIASDLLSDTDKRDIADYIASSSFTKEDYTKMLADLKIEEPGDDRAGFVIPVEYSLNEDGFSASVLSDLIEENAEQFKLQSIDVLEYFFASDKQEGACLVPDGSGVLVPFDKGTGELTMPYYGADYARNIEAVGSISKNLSLPVFGISLPDNGLFAIIEQADQTATLNVRPMSNASPLSHAYASFAIRSVESTNYGAQMSIPIYNLFSQSRIQVSPKIRYVLLTKEACQYQDMAAYYHDYLMKNGTLPASAEAAAPVYLDYLCRITEDATILGIPYTKEIVLSTVSEITESVKKLKDAGVGPCVVRLIGYGSSGYEHMVYSNYQLDRRVGTDKQLKELQALLEADGGKLYLDGDMQFAYRNGNGFSASKNASRSLNRLVVCRGEYDVVTRKLTNKLQRYLVSPMHYSAYTGRMRDSLRKAWGESSPPGISYGSSGLCLGGDYSKKTDIDRAESVYLLNNALSETKSDGFEMMFDNGNAYVLPYASHLLNVATCSSQFDVESSQAIPFYEMVIHGSISYAGTPYNLAADDRENYLTSVAMGGAPYAAFITREDTLLFHTDYKTKWHSLQDDNRLSKFIERINATAEIRQAVAGAQLTDYQYITDALVCASYSNGRRVYVNYGAKDAEADGVKISAFGFAMGGNR